MFKKSVFTWTTQIILSDSETDRTDIVVLLEWFKISFALGGSFCLSIFTDVTDNVLTKLTSRAITWCNSLCNRVGLFSKELSYNLVWSWIRLDTMFVSKITIWQFVLWNWNCYSCSKRSFCNSISKSVTSEHAPFCWFWAIEHCLHYLRNWLFFKTHEEQLLLKKKKLNKTDQIVQFSLTNMWLDNWDTERDVK